MAEKLLVRPINNITDPDEESVLAIVSHLLPVLEDWRAGEDFRIEIEELKGKKPKLDEEFAQLSNQILLVEKEFTSTFTDFKKIGPILVSAGIVLAIIGAIVYMAVILLGIAVAGYGFFTILKVKKEIKENLENLKSKSVQLQNELNQNNSRINQLQQDLLSRADTFPEVTQIRGAFQLSAKSILGKSTLLDESGFSPLTTLSTIDLSAAQSDLDLIISKINEIKIVPVLLSPSQNQEGEDPLNSLYGEEVVLQKLVDQFTENLTKIQDVEINLPLIAKNNYLADVYVGDDLIHNNYKEDEYILIASNLVNKNVIDEFVKQVNHIKEFGITLLSEIRETFESLEKICESYDFARSTSINNVHTKLFDVLNKASWCSKRFYCPRTIQAPQYIEDILNVHPSNAHKIPFDHLMEALKTDPVISARIKERLELIDELYVNYLGVHEFEGEMSFDENGNPVDLGERPAFISDQYEEALVRFRRTLGVLMTGSANPILGLSKEAEMFYDPDADEWSAETVPYVYNSSEMVRYGQVLKVTSDLMIPLWEHLWTEKADFRKSELFRTNESLIRMSEKESEKLIEIGNQFKADMRTVRENVNLLESELRSKYDEIIAFREGMASLGLLSDRQKEFLSNDRLQQITLSKENSVVKDAEEHETLLGIEPRVQAERRGTVGDPIDLVRSPDVLIEYKGAFVKRLASA